MTPTTTTRYTIGLFYVLSLVGMMVNIELMHRSSSILGGWDYSYHYEDYFPASGNVIVSKSPKKVTSTSPTTTIRQIIDDLRGGKRASCGGHKCFFPSHSNETMGWLLANNQKQYKKQRSNTVVVTSNGTVFDGMMYAWNLTTTTQQQQQQQPKTYFFRHFNIDDNPPILFYDELDSSEIQYFEDRLEEIKPTLDRKLRKKTIEKTFNVTRGGKEGGGGGIIAQRVQMAPNTGIVYTKDSGIDDHLIERMDSLNRLFATNFQKDWNMMMDLLSDHSELLFDFKFMVNDRTGQIYQIDLDRGYQFLTTTSDIENKIEYLRKQLKEILNEFNQALSN